MSKKMMKRSLALGALMAFVITGSAWAAETTIDSGTYDNGLVGSMSIQSNHTLNIGEGVIITKGVSGVQAACSSKDVTSNTINITGATINTGVLAGQGAKNSYNNIINLTSGTVWCQDIGVVINGIKVNLNKGVFAGVAVNGVSKNNQINISGGNIQGAVFGAYGRQSNDNSVNISGGEVQGTVISGMGVYISPVPLLTISSIDFKVANNIVNISGGKVSGDVYAVYVLCNDVHHDKLLEQASNSIYSSGINISGTANVENANLYGSNLTADNTSGNTLNITGWKGSESEAEKGYGTIGSAQNFNVININEGSSVLFKEALSDGNVTVNVKGATWNVDKANTVGSAYFDATSTLKIDGATFEAKDSDNVYALNGSGELKVANGATLAIKGIDYKKYNVAEGFTSIVDGNGNKFADGDEYWKLENTLMEGVWTNDNGLQVQIKAKEAEDLAEDMGVSVNIANTMTEIINIANDKKGDITEGTPQADVVKFAEALADAAPEVAGQAVEAVVKMAEEVGQSAIAASIVKNVTDITNDRLSFNCGHSAPQKGGHGVGLLEEGSGADVWVEYVHGKDEVENMKSTAGATSYEGQYNGFVMGVDFKKVNKFQSGIAFNYGEGDTNSVGSLTRTHSDYDFWGVGYYGNIHNDDSNVIFDINYAKTDSDVTQKNLTGDIEASPEATTWTAGVKVEKLYQNENVRIVPYTGLRYMSIDADDYSTKCGTYNYKMERKDIWLLPVGVSIKQEVANDNGWTVSPRVDLSYIWAFGDTDSNMGFGHALDNKITNIGYDVMDDGSFLGLVGIEAHKGQWGYGVAYSYQKGDHSESKKWYVDVNYSF